LAFLQFAVALCAFAAVAAIAEGGYAAHAPADYYVSNSKFMFDIFFFNVAYRLNCFFSIKLIYVLAIWVTIQKIIL